VFDAPLRSLLDSYDFFVMPCINPDGYEYSHNAVYLIILYLYNQLPQPLPMRDRVLTFHHIDTFTIL